MSAFFEKYKKIRLEFHKIPELAFTEKETTKLILSYLNNIPSFDLLKANRNNTWNYDESS